MERDSEDESLRASTPGARDDAALTPILVPVSLSMHGRTRLLTASLAVTVGVLVPAEAIRSALETHL